MKRVVVTGMGAVTPVGNTTEETWDALVRGHSGAGPITVMDASGFPVRIAAEVADFDFDQALPKSRDHRFLERAGQFGVASAYQALREAGLERPHYAPDDCGVAMGHSVGRPTPRRILEIARARKETGNAEACVRQSPSEALRSSPNTASNAIARLVPAVGPMVSISTACSGSGHSIGEAFRLIQEGDVRMMVAGGFDSLTTWIDLLGFSLLGALTTEYNEEPHRASRPFDSDRSGFLLGEGGVALVLEERNSAIERGAEVLAEVVGYSSTLNAWRITDSPPDGAGAVEVMQEAVAESGLGSDAFDLVVAHGTSTPGNDKSETVAIRKAFGPRADHLMVTGPKSMVGHLTSGSAALGALVAIGSIRSSMVPPTLNLENPDPACDLDYVPVRARQTPVRAALVNAFAFGGTNTCLAFAAPEGTR